MCVLVCVAKHVINAESFPEAPRLKSKSDLEQLKPRSTLPTLERLHTLFSCRAVPIVSPLSRTFDEPLLYVVSYTAGNPRQPAIP